MMDSDALEVSNDLLDDFVAQTVEMVVLVEDASFDVNLVLESLVEAFLQFNSMIQQMINLFLRSIKSLEKKQN